MLRFLPGARRRKRLRHPAVFSSSSSIFGRNQFGVILVPDKKPSNLIRQAGPLA
jgi:hypothetical protein